MRVRVRVRVRDAPGQPPSQYKEAASDSSDSESDEETKVAAYDQLLTFIRPRGALQNAVKRRKLEAEQESLLLNQGGSDEDESSGQEGDGTVQLTRAEMEQKQKDLGSEFELVAVDGDGNEACGTDDDEEDADDADDADDAGSDGSDGSESEDQGTEKAKDDGVFVGHLFEKRYNPDLGDDAMFAEYEDAVNSVNSQSAAAKQRHTAPSPSFGQATFIHGVLGAWPSAAVWQQRGNIRTGRNPPLRCVASPYVCCPLAWR